MKRLRLLPLWILLLLASTEVSAREAHSIEAEAQLRGSRVSAGQLLREDMRRYPGSWSGGAHVRWRGAQIGSRWELPISVVRSGSYTLTIHFTRAPHFGTVRVGLAGREMMLIDGFGRRMSPARATATAPITLRSGQHKLIFVSSGKHRGARGYDFAIDRIELTARGSVVPRPVPRPKPVPERAPPPAEDARPAPHSVRPLTGTDAFLPRATLAGRGSASRMTLARPYLQIQRFAVDNPAQIRFGSIAKVEHTAALPRVRRTLRIHGAWQGATRVRWQVSTFQPDPTGRVDRRPPGLIGAGVVPLVGKGSARTFAVDLRTDQAMLGGGLKDLRPQLMEIIRRADGAAEGITYAPQPPPPATPHLLDLEHRPVLYLRAIALLPDGRAVGPASTSVQIAFHRVPDVHLDREAEPGPAAQVALASFEPLRWTAADAHLRFVATRDVLWGELGHTDASIRDRVLWKKGTKFNYGAQGNSPAWYEYVSDAFGAIAKLVEWVADAITWVADQYDAIKTFAIDLAAGAVCPSSPETAASACRSLLEGALDAGLAAIGLPPELPTWDELVAAAEGELVDVIAERALAAAPGGGLAQVVTEPLAREAAAQLVRESRRRLEEAIRAPRSNGDRFSWMRPDPDFLYRPAVLRVRITNPSDRAQEGWISAVATRGGPILRAPSRRIQLAGGASRVVSLYLREATDLSIIPSTAPQAVRGERRKEIADFWKRFEGPGAPVRVVISDWRVVGTHDARTVDVAVVPHHRGALTIGRK